MTFERCSDFCKNFGLLPSDGPHVLVTTKYPETYTPVGNFVVLKLNSLSPENVSRLLTKLTDQLVVEGLDQVPLDSTRYWLRWQQSVYGVFHAVGDWVKEVRVAIKGGPVEVEIKGGH